MNKKTVNWIAIGCLVVYLIPNLIYMCNFVGKGMSSNPSDWGVYGDFIGGSINPVLTIVNITALVYLTYTVSHIEENRAQESINVQKIITLNQMRHDMVVEFSKGLDTIFSSDRNVDALKALHKLRMETYLFWKNSEYYFSDLYNEDFNKAYFQPLSYSIDLMIQYNEKGISDSDVEEELSNRYSHAQKNLLNELNKFILKEMSIKKVN